MAKTPRRDPAKLESLRETRNVESASREDCRPPFQGKRLLRPARPRAGQVRDVAAGQGGQGGRQPSGFIVRIFTGFLLPSAGNFRRTRIAGLAPWQARPSRSPQAHSRCSGLHQQGSRGPAASQVRGPSSRSGATVWNGSSSSQCRARSGAQSKKTALTEHTVVPVFPRSLSDRLAERYEDLRRQAQGEFGNRAGMVVFLRQGMTAWMAAW